MIILLSPLLGKLGTLYVKYMHDFHLKGYMCSDILFRLAILVFFHLYLMLYILSTLSVLTPLSSGGCVSCPQVQTHSSVILLPRISTLLIRRAPLFQSPVILVHNFLCSLLLVYGYGGGPVPSSFTTVLLEVCGHYVGCIYMFWIMVRTWFVWDVLLYRGSLVGCVHHCVLCQWQPCRLTYVIML